MRIKVQVAPGAGRSTIRVQGDLYLVRLSAEAKGGRANEALMQILAKHFNVSPDAVTIVSGHTSPKKVIEIVA